MNIRPLPEIELLKEILSYDAKTGKLAWKERRGSGGSMVLPGDTAGGVDHGYIVIRVNSRKLYAHRVIWALVHGMWPERKIDHINGNGLDNRLKNLREVTDSQSSCNTKTPRNSASGTKGVCFSKQKKKWMAYIQLQKKWKCLGFFVSKEAAEAARIQAQGVLHGEYARAV